MRQLKVFGRLLVAIMALSVVAAGAVQAATPAWRPLAVTGPTDLPPVTSEIQKVAVNAEGGTFTLSFEGGQTAALPFDAEPAELQAALDGLASVGGRGGKVRVIGGPGNPGAELPYFVSFEGTLAGQDVAQMAADGSGLQGAGASATVTTPTPGSSIGKGELVVFPTNVGGVAASGTFKATVTLPAGITTAGQGEGSAQHRWSCPSSLGLTMVECTYSGSVASIATGEPLILPLAIDGSTALPSSTATVKLEGGAGASTPVATYEAPVVVSATPARPGVQAFWAGAFDADGEPETQAGGHPAQAITAFFIDTVLSADGRVIPAGDLRDSEVDLPPGFLGNPLIAKRCPDSVPAPLLAVGGKNLLCNSSSTVGQFEIFSQQLGFGSNSFSVYDDVPPPGYAAQFTGEILPGILQRVVASVRGDEDFGVRATAFNIPPANKMYGIFFALTGFPAGAAGKPFLANPTDCSLQATQRSGGTGPLATVSTNTWQPGTVFASRPDLQPAVTGCRALTESWLGAGPEPKKPSFEFTPTVTQAASGTGATAHLHISQEGLSEAGKLATSQLKKTVVSLPAGLSLNPSAATGLEACTESQIGRIYPEPPATEFPMPTPIRFNEEPAKCPEGSKLGTVTVHSPLLEESLEGTIYLAAQEENPFNSLIALYLVIESERFGLTLKLPGEVKPNPSTGQLTATFDDNPQLPFEELELHFRGGGPRSELSTPAVCGSYKTTGSLTPWSAETESPNEAARIEEEGFQITSGPGGGHCATSESGLPFSPSFEAGTTSTQAGSYSPLVIKLARKDGEQELTRLEFTLPKGLTGKLAGVPYCSDQAIAEAAGKSGKAEQANPSCPAASELGTVDTSAGVGSEPIHVGGKVYLAGPYEGAPLSSVVITPAVAGPFDLGTVVVRAPLFVNPETAQITAKSDPIPTILKGIPLKLRSVEIKVSRQDFTLNPTSCEPMAVTSSMSGLNGGNASPQSRFQVGGCENLAFKPKLSIQLKGGTRRNKYPALTATLTQKPGQANIRYAQVALPHSEFLEQSHIRTVCTRVQFAANSCPRGAIYGHAEAETPLLGYKLAGPVYLRSSDNPLPDLVAVLRGPDTQPIEVDLDGRIDSHKGGIRNTFEVVPDAPVSKFVLKMQGGKKGLLVNSTNLCTASAKQRTATVRIIGQNNKSADQSPLLANQCAKHKAKAKKPKRHQHKRASLARALGRAW